MYEPLQVFLYLIISLVFLVFLLLDGFDMGIGMILPFFPQTDSGHRKLLDLVWPFWDGNELWAIIGGSLLLAAFPEAFVALMGSFAPVLALILGVLMFRPISFEAWYRDAKHRRVWELIQAIGSFLLSFGLGFVLGTLLEGLPLTSTGGIEGAPLSAVRPFAVIVGLLTSAVSVLGGLFFIRKKTDGSVREKSISFSRIVLPITAALSAAVVLSIIILVPETRTRPVFWVAVVLAVACFVLLLIAVTKSNDDIPFYLSSAATVSVWIAGTIALFPYLLRPAGGGAGLAIGKAASPETSMQFLAVIVPVALIILTGYSIFIYRIFKGKANPLEY